MLLVVIHCILSAQTPDERAHWVEFKLVYQGASGLLLEHVPVGGQGWPPVVGAIRIYRDIRGFAPP